MKPEIREIEYKRKAVKYLRLLREVYKKQGFVKLAENISKMLKVMGYE